MVVVGVEVVVGCVVGVVVVVGCVVVVGAVVVVGVLEGDESFTGVASWDGMILVSSTSTAGPLFPNDGGDVAALIYGAEDGILSTGNSDGSAVEVGFPDAGS